MENAKRVREFCRGFGRLALGLAGACPKFRGATSGDFFELFQKSLGPHPDPPIVGQVPPPNDAVSVEQESGGTRDIDLPLSPFGMSDAKRVDGPQAGVGQQRVSDSKLVGKVQAVADGVGADSQHLGPGLSEIIDP